jgi:hypothetical protein
MELLASIQVKDHTPVPALQDGLAPTARPGSPMNAATTIVSMVVLVR